MNWISILLTLIGVATLAFSLKPATKICQKDNHIGWRVLCSLIVFFILGYCSVLYYLFQHPTANNLFTAFSVILCGGGFFVFIVINMSLQSIIKIEQVADKERYNALHDNLTNLPNRKYLLQQMRSYAQQNSAFSLLSIDLNNFKQVNDALGHHYGDELLVAVSARIRRVLPETAFFARMGGDEFAIIHPSAKEPDYQNIVSIVHHALQSPFQLVGYAINVYASMGGSLFPFHSKQIDELLKQADMAMYASKNKRLEFTLFCEELNKGANEKLSISSRIEQAIENNEFELHYQAIFDENKHIHGAEALIRWPQADGSYIDTETFIKISEQSTLIEKITIWVLDQAIKDLAALKEQGFTGALHINLSAQNLQSPTFFQHVSLLFESQQVPTDQLVFEVTESAMMINLEATQEMMRKLNSMGFEFSIDDFGTGFSSLSLLRELPIKQIKIDRSFISKMASDEINHSIVKSAIYLAKNLHCTTVAEGVESCLVAEHLIALKCDYLQGYLYCDPLPLPRFIHNHVGKVAGAAHLANVTAIKGT